MLILQPWRTDRRQRGRSRGRQKTEFLKWHATPTRLLFVIWKHAWMLRSYESVAFRKNGWKGDTSIERWRKRVAELAYTVYFYYLKHSHKNSFNNPSNEFAIFFIIGALRNSLEVFTNSNFQILRTLRNALYNPSKYKIEHIRENGIKHKTMV